ncbi:uncharacterized protein BJ212DRAFT_1486000 [Suillus subaureus]|uniref:Uncharacterized protein n=1 Tax=Suillus subaureus TaxID=48587 RepID=A0A9P7J732_9AGAM|nr:uncharacterized protein BJ212DRAFT_1486000 [Suillus subaureus]KAG1806082.1 hypothetical protein BJ212DRAFT_1486000 [Suillus subaureus]
MLCNVKVSIHNKSEIVEVLYFAQLAVMVHADDINEDDNDEEFKYIDNEIYHFVTIAMVSVYSCPDPELLQKSAQTVWSCTYHGNEALQLVSMKMIHSVVTMVPHCPKLPSGLVEDHFFLVEKPGLGLVSVDEEMGDDADKDE